VPDRDNLEWKISVAGDGGGQEVGVLGGWLGAWLGGSQGRVYSEGG
jgi:hypothetical protein